jgi:hypothetical protein
MVLTCFIATCAGRVTSVHSTSPYGLTSTLTERSSTTPYGVRSFGDPLEPR